MHCASRGPVGTRSVDSARDFGKISIEKVCWNRVGPAGAGREEPMKTGKKPSIVAAALLAGVSVSASAQQQSDAASIKIGERDIGGIISSPRFPHLRPRDAQM